VKKKRRKEWERRAAVALVSGRRQGGEMVGREVVFGSTVREGLEVRERARKRESKREGATAAGAVGSGARGAKVARARDRKKTHSSIVLK